jgi:hypothetical protein
MKKIIFGFLLMLSFNIAGAAILLIPMDETQKNHLKAYGISYWVLSKGITIDWLLNYQGGSFAMAFSSPIEKECLIRGVSYQILADAQYNKIKADIAVPEVNMDVVKLEKPPKIAVYSPKTKQPWDDAVTLAMTYAEIPYDIIFDDEIMQGKLPLYDWVHLHHEDFTGQYGKFYGSYHNEAWYKADVKENQDIASRWGMQKVSQLKLAVAKKLREFVAGGGYLFAMCTATDTYDIALAADGLDICESMFDGDAVDPTAEKKLDYSQTFAFTNFSLVRDPYEVEFSSIDVPQTRMMQMNESNDYFTIFDYSAKWDQIPAMLCQNHTRLIKGFMGQTTAFRKQYIKSSVLVMGENKSLNEARYIHGEFGKGMWTFYGGHDPEDYQHMVYEPPTDLSLHPNSPGYRLILNNVLFPAAKKQKRKT